MELLFSPLGTTTRDSIRFQILARHLCRECWRAFPSIKLFCSLQLFSFASSVWQKNTFTLSGSKSVAFLNFTFLRLVSCLQKPRGGMAVLEPELGIYIYHPKRRARMHYGVSSRRSFACMNYSRDAASQPLIGLNSFSLNRETTSSNIIINKGQERERDVCKHCDPPTHPRWLPPFRARWVRTPRKQHVWLRWKSWSKLRCDFNFPSFPPN